MLAHYGMAFTNSNLIISHRPPSSIQITILSYEYDKRSSFDNWSGEFLISWNPFLIKTYKLSTSWQLIFSIQFIFTLNPTQTFNFDINLYGNPETTVCFKGKNVKIFLI